MIDAPSPDTITTRAVQPNDRMFLAEVYKSSRGDDLRGLGWDEERISEFLEMQHEAQENFNKNDYQNATDEVLMMGDQQIGHLMFEPRSHEIRLIDVALLPQYRGHGFGTRIIQRLQEKAKTEKMPVRLQVIRFSRAVNLFERLGFVRTSETGTHFQMEWLFESRG